jgi:hypothetical protein
MVMAYTSHGHHIPGTLKGEGVTKANSVARCGGPNMCRRCKQDVADYMSAITGTSEDFQQKAKEIVKNYLDGLREKAGLEPLVYELYVPWFSKSLQNWKATVGTSLADGFYFELAYDGNKRQTYLDFYQKRDNVVIPD